MPYFRIWLCWLRCIGLYYTLPDSWHFLYRVKILFLSSFASNDKFYVKYLLSYNIFIDFCDSLYFHVVLFIWRWTLHFLMEYGKDCSHISLGSSNISNSSSSSWSSRSINKTDLLCPFVIELYYTERVGYPFFFFYVLIHTYTHIIYKCAPPYTNNTEWFCRRASTLQYIILFLLMARTRRYARFPQHCPRLTRPLAKPVDFSVPRIYVHVEERMIYINCATNSVLFRVFFNSL